MKIRVSPALTAVIFALALALGTFVPSSMATTSLEKDASAEVGACGKCGDGYCNKRCGETAASCPKDCAVSSDSFKALTGN